MKKINITNVDKLAEAIKVAEGRAKERTVTAEDIICILNKIEVPKSRLNGTVVHYDGGEHFANAYKYAPMSTHWTAENIHGKWYVTDIRRNYCPNRKTRSGYIEFSEAAKEWIIQQASMI